MRSTQRTLPSAFYGTRRCSFLSSRKCLSTVCPLLLADHNQLDAESNADSPAVAVELAVRAVVWVFSPQPRDRIVTQDLIETVVIVVDQPDGTEKAITVAAGVRIIVDRQVSVRGLFYIHLTPSNSVLQVTTHTCLKIQKNSGLALARRA